MIDFLKAIFAKAFAITTVIFTFSSESFFARKSWISQSFINEHKLLIIGDAQDANIAISRIICFSLMLLVASILHIFSLLIKRRVKIKGRNYCIVVEYGNILKKKRCKRVINFDECFTTQVGEGIPDINPDSLCGQYLKSHQIDVQQLIGDAHIKPAKSKSKYQNKIRYNSGTIVPNDDDLLMAFAKLDKKGKGRFFSRDEYLDCLNLLWKELENYYSEKDVCIPILGSGTTTLDDSSGASIPKQELLDMIILSYKLSSHKIKSPHKLHIVCTRSEDFSINKVS